MICVHTIHAKIQESKFIEFNHLLHLMSAATAWKFGKLVNAVSGTKIQIWLREWWEKFQRRNTAGKVKKTWERKFARERRLNLQNQREKRIYYRESYEGTEEKQVTFLWSFPRWWLHVARLSVENYVSGVVAFKLALHTALVSSADREFLKRCTNDVDSPRQPRSTEFFF